MGKLFRLTVKRTENGNKVKLTKGMSVEIATQSGKPNGNNLELIAQLLESKYGTLCTKNFIAINDFDIEEIK